MAPILPINLSYSVRRRLAYVMQFMHLLSCLFGVSLLLFGSYMMSFIGKLALALGGTYNYGFLYFTVSVALASTFIHIIGLRVCHYLADWMVLYKHNLMTPLLFIIYGIPLTANIILIAVFTSMSSTFSEEIKKTFESGMKISMDKYKDNKEVKRVIDETQTHYQCCGAVDFQDWFYTSWINTKYIDFKTQAVIANTKSDGLFKPVSVPFSCCKLMSRRPCINTYINDKTKHYKYQPEVDMTVNIVGCGEAVSSFVRSSFMFHYQQAGIAFSIIEFVMIIVYRYVATSSVVALSGGNPLFTAPGYLFNFGGSIKPVFPKTQVEYLDKMDQLQAMADKRLDDKFRQDRGPPPEGSDDDEDEEDNDNDNANENFRLQFNINRNATVQRSQFTNHSDHSRRKVSEAAIKLSRSSKRRNPSISSPSSPKQPGFLSGSILPTDYQPANVRTARWVNTEASSLVMLPTRTSNEIDATYVHHGLVDNVVDVIQSKELLRTTGSQNVRKPSVPQTDPKQSSVAHELMIRKHNTADQRHYKQVALTATLGQESTATQEVDLRTTIASDESKRKQIDVAESQLSSIHPKRIDDDRVQHLEKRRPLLKANSSNAKYNAEQTDYVMIANASRSQQPADEAGKIKTVKMSLPQCHVDKAPLKGQKTRISSVPILHGGKQSKTKNTTRLAQRNERGLEPRPVLSARAHAGSLTDKSITKQDDFDLVTRTASGKLPQARRKDSAQRKSSNTDVERSYRDGIAQSQCDGDRRNHRKFLIPIDAHADASEARSRSLERPPQHKQQVSMAVSVSVPPPEVASLDDSVVRKPPLPKHFRPYSATRLRTSCSVKSCYPHAQSTNHYFDNSRVPYNVLREVPTSNGADQIQSGVCKAAGHHRHPHETVVEMGHIHDVSAHNNIISAPRKHQNWPTSMKGGQHLVRCTSTSRNVDYAQPRESVQIKTPPFRKPVAETTIDIACRKIGQTDDVVVAGYGIPSCPDILSPHNVIVSVADTQLTPSDTSILNSGKKRQDIVKHMRISEVNLIPKSNRADEHLRDNDADDIVEISGDESSGISRSENNSSSCDVSWTVSSDDSSDNEEEDVESDASPSSSDSDDAVSQTSSSSDE